MDLLRLLDRRSVKHMQKEGPNCLVKLTRLLSGLVADQGVSPHTRDTLSFQRPDHKGGV